LLFDLFIFFRVSLTPNYDAAAAQVSTGPALLLSILSAFLGMFGCFSTVPGAEQAPASSSLT
jgi:hypothetical protein